MATVKVSAPGKVILHGEHAVVYGKRALAASLNLRTSLVLEVNDDGRVEVSLPDINLEASWNAETLSQRLPLPFCKPLIPEPPAEGVFEQLLSIASESVTGEVSETRILALVSFLYLFGSISDNTRLPGVRIRVNSCLPASAGLGSSAAYSSCLAASLLFHKKLLSPSSKECLTDKDRELINKWAFQAEKIIHGRPSGIDNSVSTFGRVMSFQSGVITPIKRVPSLRILLVNTGVPRSTKVLVAGVKDRYDKYLDIYKPVLDSIEAISNRCEEALSQLASSDDVSQYDVLQDLVKMNQQLLNFIGVGHESLNKVSAIFSGHGLEAKLTGAGGGGCAFSILPPGVGPDKINAVSAELSSLGYTCWETEIGGDGVSVDS